MHEGQRSHKRPRQEERGRDYTPSQDRGNCDHTRPPGTTDRGKEHQDEEDSSKKCCRRKETTQGTRGSDIIRVISGANAISSLAEVPADERQNIEDMPSRSSTSLSSKLGFFNWATSLSTGKEELMELDV